MYVSVPFRGIKNRKASSTASWSRDDMFQSPFGELKIGKLGGAIPRMKGMDWFQSPFGELKIGKKYNNSKSRNPKYLFQSPFGELKIGKFEAAKKQYLEGVVVSVPFRGIKNRKDQSQLIESIGDRLCFSPLSGN